jgi:hypothetical protein
LEHQLEAEREANREHRRLLAAALDRIPQQLEAPAEPPQTVEEGPGVHTAPLRYGRVSGGRTEAVVAEVVRVSRRRNARRSGLSEAAVEGLARRVMVAICREWPRSKGSLDSSVVYARLVMERAELPDYAMHDALKRLEENELIIAPPSEIRSDDEVRAHGGMTIEGVDTNFCAEV